MVSQLFIRGSVTGDVFADAKISGHIATHLNVCCDPENPCEGVDLDDYFFSEELGEWCYHPVDGVCCVLFEDGELTYSMDIDDYPKFVVFEGDEVPATDFYIDDGNFARPLKVLGVFDSLDDAVEFAREIEEDF